jgi:hypothetical protein
MISNLAVQLPLLHDSDVVGHISGKPGKIN